MKTMKLLLITALFAGGLDAQQGPKVKPGAQQDSINAAVEARLDSIVAELARFGPLEQDDHLAAADRIRIESRLDSLIAVVQAGQPPDSGFPPVMGDTARIVAYSADSLSVTVEASWTQQPDPITETLIVRETPRLNLGDGDAQSPLRFDVPRGATESVIGVSVERWAHPPPRTSADYIGRQLLANLRIPAAPQDTVTNPPGPGPNPPPNPGSAQPGPNAPSGYTTFAAVEFNSMSADGRVDAGPLQEATPGGLNPQVPASSPLPNSPSLQTHYPAGFQAGTANGTRMFTRPNTNFAVQEFYISWRGGVSSGFVGQAGGQFKAMGIRRSGNQAAWLDIHGVGTGPLEFRVDQKIGDYQRGDSGQRWLRPNRSACSVIRGRVHFFEMNWQASSARGATDGVVRWWLDGVLCGEYTNVETVGNPGLGTNGQVLCNCIEDIAITPIWGGSTGTTPNAFEYWIDDLVVMGR